MDGDQSRPAALVEPCIEVLTHSIVPPSCRLSGSAKLGEGESRSDLAPSCLLSQEQINPQMRPTRPPTRPVCP